MKKDKRVLKIIGIMLSITAISLSLYWYDWKLALIIFLFVAGHNGDKHIN